jgi:hypothetical protein
MKQQPPAIPQARLPFHGAFGTNGLCLDYFMEHLGVILVIYSFVGIFVYIFCNESWLSLYMEILVEIMLP